MSTRAADLSMNWARLLVAESPRRVSMPNVHALTCTAAPS